MFLNMSYLSNNILDCYLINGIDVNLRITKATLCFYARDTSQAMKSNFQPILCIVCDFL